jgi:hypothetical protein
MSELIDHLKVVHQTDNISKLDIPYVTKLLNNTSIFCFVYHKAEDNIAMHAVSMIMTKIETDHNSFPSSDFIMLSSWIRRWLDLKTETDNDNIELNSTNLIDIIKRTVRYAYRLCALSALSTDSNDYEYFIHPSYFGITDKWSYFNDNEMYYELYKFAIIILIQSIDLVKGDIELMQWVAIFYRYMFCDMLDFNKEFTIKNVIKLPGILKLNNDHIMNTIDVILSTESEEFEIYDGAVELCKQNIYDSLYYLNYKHDPIGWMIKECSADNSDITKLMHSNRETGKHHLATVWAKYLAVQDDFISNIGKLIKEPETLIEDDDTMQHNMLRNILLLIFLDKWFARRFNYKKFMSRYVLRKSDFDSKLFHKVLLSREPLIYEYAPFQWGILYESKLYIHNDMSVLISEWYEIVSKTLHNKIVPGPGEVVYIKDFMQMSTQLIKKTQNNIGVVRTKVKGNDYETFMNLLNSK